MCRVKMSNILFVVCAVFIVTCVTQNDDASYMKLYHKLQRDLTLIQTVAHGSAKEIDNQFSQTRINAHKKLVENRATWKNVLNNEEQKTLSMLDMASDIYQIESCVNESNILIDQLIQISEDSFNNCSNLLAYGLASGKSNLNGLFASLREEYQNLENVNYYCSKYYSQQYYECLYTQYEIQAKGMNNLKIKSREVVELYFANYIKEGDDLVKCIDNIINNAQQQVSDFVDIFNTCCGNAE